MVRIEDFLQYTSLSDVTVSADGAFAAFVATKPNPEQNNYTATLFVLDRASGDRREVFSCSGGVSYKWHGAQLLVKTGKENDKTVYSYINPSNGEITFAFDVPFSVTNLEPIGETLFAVTSMTDCNTRVIPPELGYINAHVKYEIIDELPFWSNGRGFTNKRRNALFLFDSVTGRLERVTETLMNVNAMRVFGGNLYFTAETYDDICPAVGLYVLRKGEVKPECLIEQGRIRIHEFGLLQGNVFVIGSDTKTKLMTDNPVFYMLTKDGKLVELFDEDMSIASGIVTDCKQGANRIVRIHGDYIYFVSTDEYSSQIYRVNTDGNCEQLTTERGSVDGFDIAQNGNILFVAMRGQNLQELYELTADGERALTDFNTNAYSAISIPETFTFQNGGFNVNYVVLKPLNFDESKTYPALVYIHGGAKVCYSEVFFHEMQVLAAKGYFVLHGNPRGSDGQGSEFARLCGQYGTIDFDDIMMAVEKLTAAYPQIDKERLGVLGGSYGGIMTNFIVGKTNIFKCAVAQRSISNMTTALCAADNGYHFVREQMASDPWNNTEKLWAQSPLAYAHNAKTPTLFIHSTEDYRCHYVEAMQMFSALRLHGVDSRICLIEGENHELSRSGRPMQRILRMTEIFSWLDKYLQ